MNKNIKTREEDLKRLYESFGYSQFKMSKFEEYDLYVRNKSFLVSDHIIAFTDTDGKLMALKPDVTLSIVKNSPEQESGVRKVYYNEHVYRVPRGGFSFKEIPQTGLECIGDIDTLRISEVLTLAAKSLEIMSADYVIDVSHMGIVAYAIDRLELSASGRNKVVKCLGEKNIHGIEAVCLEENVDDSCADVLKRLIAIKGGCDELLDILRGSDAYSEAMALAETVSAVKDMGYNVNIDFSVTDDMKYYSGIVFKGFVKGIPTSVLSGGRYDNLMKKMGKNSSAIGFAVYLDCFAGFDNDDREYDADALILYDAKSDVKTVLETADRFSRENKIAVTAKKVDDDFKYREFFDLRGNK